MSEMHIIMHVGLCLAAGAFGAYAGFLIGKARGYDLGLAAGMASPGAGK